MDKFFARIERNDEKGCCRLSGRKKFQITKSSSSFKRKYNDDYNVSASVSFHPKKESHFHIV